MLNTSRKTNSLMRYRILVLGGTGYVGTRLVSMLSKTNHHIRIGYRNMDKIREKSWHSNSNLEYSKVDVLDKSSLIDACKDIDIVYYLVHSMNPKASNFESTDNIAAYNMIHAAEQNHVKLMVYLGGLGDENPSLSKHLKSRAEVGNILQSSKIPTTILRAAIIIGSGSASFEILRYLMERLPIMITPKWVYTKNQPIAIQNVITYLIGVIDQQKTWGSTYDIGGPEVLTYKELMEIYSKEANLWKRLIIPIPVLTPKLSSYWVDLITPLNKEIARPLVEGLRNEVITSNNEIREIIPQELIKINEAIGNSLRERNHKIYHSKAKSLKAETPAEFSASGDPEWSGGSFLYDRRAIRFRGRKSSVWTQIEKIGGKTGWYYGNFLWKIRGILDELIGGVGMRRGRKNQDKLIKGDYVDCWTVLDIADNKSLLLKSEMRLPGYASLKFEISNSDKPDEYILDQYATFVPRGLGGMLYWYLVLPLHMSVFEGMIKGIIKASDAKMISQPYLIPKTKIFNKNPKISFS